MTTAWRAAAALVFLLGSATPALAQEPAKVIDPHDKNAVRPGPGIELGFYDPATGLFTRETPSASTVGHEIPVAGILELFIILVFFERRSSASLVLEASAAMGNSSQVSATMGNSSQSRSDVSQFTANYYAKANANFAVDAPNKSISIPFAYTPAGNSAQMSISVNAQVIDDNNITHSFTVFLPLEPVPNGNVTRKVRITM